MAEDIRWKQRFQNFNRAYRLLCEPLEEDAESLSELEKEGVVQRFEYTFELAWKCLNDFMREQGVSIAPLTPRAVIKQAAAAQIIANGQAWIDMLEHRNLLSHTYDETTFDAAVKAIASRYLGEFEKLRLFLAEEENK